MIELEDEIELSDGRQMRPRPFLHLSHRVAEVSIETISKPSDTGSNFIEVDLLHGRGENVRPEES